MVLYHDPQHSRSIVFGTFSRACRTSSTSRITARPSGKGFSLYSRTHRSTFLRRSLEIHLDMKVSSSVEDVTMQFTPSKYTMADDDRHDHPAFGDMTGSGAASPECDRVSLAMSGIVSRIRDGMALEGTHCPIALPLMRAATTALSRGSIGNQATAGVTYLGRPGVCLVGIQS